MSDTRPSLVNKLEYPQNIIFYTRETWGKKEHLSGEVHACVTLCVRAPVSRTRISSLVTYKYDRSGDRLISKVSLTLSSLERLKVTSKVLEELCGN
jgi:hypothetical protein